jgi:CRAL/TRIO domain
MLHCEFKLQIFPSSCFQGDIAKAIQRIRWTLTWRTDNHITELVRIAENKIVDETLREVMIRQYEDGIIYTGGYDVDGRVILRVNPKAFRLEKRSLLLQSFALQIEKAIACTKRKSVQLQSSRNGCPLEKVIVVVDYRTFSMKDQSNLTIIKELLSMVQTHYPERLHRAYIICPPIACRIMWSVIRPFVDPSTKNKVTFCANKNELNELSNKIANDLFTRDDIDTEKQVFDVIDYLSLPFDETLSE